jgi:hypothetical protein
LQSGERFSIDRRRGSIKLPVRPLRFLIDVFVNTFGITPPTPENEAKSGKVIALMLGGVALLLVVVVLLLRASLSR